MEKLGKILRQATYSIYELLVILWDKLNDVIDNLNGKTDNLGDHLGTWQGYRPSQVDAALTAIMDEMLVMAHEKATHIYPTMTTSEIQTVLDTKREVLFVNGTFNVSPLFLKSDTVIYMSPNTVIQAIGGYGQNDCVFSIKTQTNVTIYGNGAELTMPKSEYTTGEWRHGVYIVDSTNITISNLHSNNSGGDGFYIGTASPTGFSKDILLLNCYADNNRRQGLSIVSAKNVLVEGGLYSNTIGTAPSSGIDIEPNVVGNFIENINIVNVCTEGNDGSGISVVPNGLGNPISVNITGYTSKNDCKNVARLGGGIYFANSPTAKLYGKINVRDSRVINSGMNGVMFQRWNNFAPKVILENVYVENPSVNISSERYRNGFSFSIDNTEVATYFGNVDIINCEAVDTRLSPLMFMPFYLNTASNVNPLRYINIVNPKGANWVYTNNGVPVLLTVNTIVKDCNIIYDKEIKITELASQTLSLSWHGSTICNSATVSAPKYTLPSPTNFIGMEVSFRLDVDGDIWIQPQATDIIKHFSNGVGGAIIAWSKGSYIKLRAVSATEWQVLEDIGKWTVYPMKEARLPQMCSGAVPTTGDWVKGDIIWNTNTFSTGFIGWVCTASGTPGTWSTFGLIS